MANKLKHWMYGTPTHHTYQTWTNMIQRCTNPLAWGFKNYGGRGITVCKRWLKFENFLKDMGVRPEGKTIERINNNAGYTKSNCRWATTAEQSVNRRNNRPLTFESKTQPMSVWAKELNIRYETLAVRKHRGWSDERALSTAEGGGELLLTIQGVTRNVTEWARIKGIDICAVLGRLNRGWSPEDAVNTAVVKQQRFRRT